MGHAHMPRRAARRAGKGGAEEKGHHMLFFLTGDIQTGKTRWLSSLVQDLERFGMRAVGVLAPGVWRERSACEIAARKARCEDGKAGNGDIVHAHPDPSGAGRFEKLGIDNVLLPQHERIAFARRRDLAREAGAYRPGSQSARAGLGWEIDDGAVARVNAHFARLAAEAATRAEAGQGGGGAGRGAGSLLVVDELGRLELLRGEGLVEAMRLLQTGPGARFPHALVVVRNSLLEEAHAAFGGIWPDMADIAPDDEAREMLCRLFGCA